MYESQIQSKKYRQLDKTLGAYFRTDDLYSQLYQKHFKKTYAGKPTKRKKYRQLEKLCVLTLSTIWTGAVLTSTAFTISAFTACATTSTF